VSTTDWDRLGRYMAGELSSAEAEEVRRWLRERPEEAAALGALDSATRGVAPARSVDVEGALRKVKTRGTARARHPGVALRMIAAAAVLVAAGLYASWGHRQGQAPREFATGVGQTDTIALAGASTAILGPGSSLTLSGREVLLGGTALFSIRESGSGYVVRANGVVVRDIGTEFVVETTADGVRVAVASGAVQLERSGLTITADSGDVADVGSDIGVRRGAFTADDLAFTEGRLVLRNARLRDVAAQLRRWYGVELEVPAALEARHFTGTFEREPVDRVVEIIALAVGATAQRAGDTIRLLPVAGRR